MTNVKAEIKGNILTLTVNLTERHGRSKSGKSETIATTNGNANLATAEGLQFAFGLNVYTKGK